MADRPEPEPRVSNAFIGGHNIQLGYVDGDVTILLDSVGYRVEFLTPGSAESAQPPSGRPSYLLDPRHQVVPYRPRLAEQALLENWLTGGQERTSVLLVTGPAGQGKTRLAGHVASTLHRQGWAVAQAVPRSPRRTDAPSTKVLDPSQPLLVVVDYAERWHLATLTQLVDKLAKAYASRRVRVLMLSRQGGFVWETIAAELDELKPDPKGTVIVDLAKPVALGEFTAERAAAFADAVHAFAARMRHHDRPTPPGNLADTAYASPLTLHMAALAAVYTAATGDSGPDDQDPQALSRYLLRHERRYWHATSTAPQNLPAIPAATIEEAVWWATLCGPVTSHRAALDFLRGAGLADGDAEAGRLLQVYERLYPAARGEPVTTEAGARPTVATLLPLQPDRLGEDFTGEYLATQDHAAGRLADLAAAQADDSAFDIRRCVIVLAATATRHPAAEVALRALLDQRPDLGPSGGAGVLRFVTGHASRELAGRVCAELPMHPAAAGPRLPQFDADLVGPAIELTRRVLSDLPVDAPADLRAHHLLHHGNRLAHAGCYDDAFIAIHRAIELYGRLAKADRGYEPHLATASASHQNAKYLELLQRHELGPRESVTRVRLWPDGIALTTNLRHFVAGPEPAKWLISKEDWVSDVMIAIRDDIILDEPERFGYLLLADGGDVNLNDEVALAELGRRLRQGMNPVAYAQLVVQFHRYRGAQRLVLLTQDQVRRAYGRNDLPGTAQFDLRRTDDGLLLTFDVALTYMRSRKYPVSSPKLDVESWAIQVPDDGPAQWSSRLVVEGIGLHPRRY